MKNIIFTVTMLLSMQLSASQYYPFGGQGVDLEMSSYVCIGRDGMPDQEVSSDEYEKLTQVARVVGITTTRNISDQGLVLVVAANRLRRGSEDKHAEEGCLSAQPTASDGGTTVAVVKVDPLTCLSLAIGFLGDMRAAYDGARASLVRWFGFDEKHMD